MSFPASRPIVTSGPSGNSDFLKGPLIARSLVATVRPFFLCRACRCGESHYKAVILALTVERSPLHVNNPIHIDKAAIRMARVPSWLAQATNLRGCSFCDNPFCFCKLPSTPTKRERSQSRRNQALSLDGFRV